MEFFVIFLGRGDRYDPGHRIGPDGSQITIHDTPPLAYYQQGQPGNGSGRSAHSAGTSGHQRKIPEVITISDSDDETSPSNSAKLQHHTHVQAAQAAAAAAAAVGQLPVYSSTSGTQDSKVVTSTAGNKTPAITTTTSSARTLKVPMSSSNVNNTNPSSGCPSVMALTPSNIKSQAPSVSGETPGTGSGFVSTQSTPCASRSHATSCVTVGDSDEDTSLQNSPLKTEPGLLLAGSNSSQTSGGLLGPGPSGSSGGPSQDPRDRGGVTTPARELNKKTRLLKAQSEWMLSSLKEEGSPAALGGPLGSLPTGASAVFGAGTPSRGGPSSSYGSYSRLSVVDEKELMHRYSTSSTLR